MDDITLPELSRDELIEKATYTYNKHAILKGIAQTCWARKDSDPRFLDRICVNYLRHMETGYHKTIRKLRNRNSTPSLFDDARNTVLSHIANQYPWLRDECEWQKTKHQSKRNN